jgi:hypothetical protein
MARTDLAVTKLSDVGEEVSLSAANADGHYVQNNERTFLYVVNAHTSAWNVTIQTPNTVKGLAIADRVVAVANGEASLIGPFPASVYNDSLGRLLVDYEGTTALTVGAYSL